MKARAIYLRRIWTRIFWTSVVLVTILFLLILTLQFFPTGHLGNLRTPIGWFGLNRQPYARFEDGFSDDGDFNYLMFGYVSLSGFHPAESPPPWQE